jgi:nitric oxide reductase NorD protein
MEEYVGSLWHRFITKAAEQTFPDAAVSLEEVHKTVGVLFRALGGDGGLRIEAVSATAHQARRTWLQKVAGTAKHVELAWRDQETLRLPSQLAVFPDKSLNRDTFLWLAALATSEHLETDWFIRNQLLTQITLQRFQGLESRYQKLVENYLPLRRTKGLTPEELAQELAIQHALKNPFIINKLPICEKPPQPVHLWLHPSPPMRPAAVKAPSPPENPPEGETKRQNAKDQRRRSGERTEAPDGKTGLLAFRLESLFSRAEYVKVDRTTDDEEDLSKAQDALEDMEHLSITQDNKNSATTLKFDLDLPPNALEETPLEGEILLPEWDYKKQLLRENFCNLQMYFNANAQAIELPHNLRKTAQRLKQQFEALAPTRIWHRNQAEGNDIDLEAYLLHAADNLRGQADAAQGLYRDFRGGSRDLACLLLADLSMSTDAWVNNFSRVIDVIRDSLFLFAEALSSTGDKFALYGFSSRQRQHIRFNVLKTFEQSYTPIIRGNIQAIKPGFYTRMGAAIRQSTNILSKQPNAQRLLLLLTDGKPNDLDHYEGRYGVEDTRQAIHEARRKGLQVFCVTIDEQAGDYLGYLFGNNGYVFIRNPAELPKQLPLLYMRLTAGE